MTVIDENKVNTLFHIVNKRTIYSDHCSIILKMDWQPPTDTTEKETHKIRVNTKNLETFYKMTSGKKLTDITKKMENIEIIYKKWKN